MIYHRRAFHRRKPHPRHSMHLLPRLQESRADEGIMSMRALTLIYHEDFEPAVTGIIQRKMLVARYTKVRDVLGARADIMQEADYTPTGQNHMLFIVATKDVIEELAAALRELRHLKGHGLRGYITPVEGLI